MRSPNLGLGRQGNQPSYVLYGASADDDDSRVTQREYLHQDFSHACIWKCTVSVGGKRRKSSIIVEHQSPQRRGADSAEKWLPAISPIPSSSLRHKRIRRPWE